MLKYICINGTIYFTNMATCTMDFYLRVLIYFKLVYLNKKKRYFKKNKILKCTKNC